VPRVKRFLSPALFGVVIVMFAMPFMLVSCSGQQQTSISGLQLVTGTEVGAGMSSQHIGSQPAVLLALALAIAGVALGFARFGWRNVAATVAGAIGAVALYLWSNAAVQSIEQQGLQAQKGDGLNWAMLFFLAAAGVSAYLAVDARRQQPAEGSQRLSSPASPEGGAARNKASGARFCPHCGTPAPSEGRFCGSCGGSLE